MRQTSILKIPRFKMTASGITQDLTDDPDPLIGEKIAKIHADRFASDKGLVDLVNSLGSYQGSSAEKL